MGDGDDGDDGDDGVGFSHLPRCADAKQRVVVGGA